VTSAPQNRIERLARFGLVTPDAARLSRFYQAALGFRLLADDRRPGRDFLSSTESGGDAQCITLGLGHEIVELLQFDRPGRLYPDAALASDLRFQHFAIVVTDMAEAYRRLCSVFGWTAISIDGPQRLPASSGGVSAFKFRDPDGHPLELLAFPEAAWPAPWKARSSGDLALGIDHSAISVSDSARSIAFYESLGLRMAGHSLLNVGDEQARLDGVSHPHVEVTALTPRRVTPHLELLCYRSAMAHGSAGLRADDVAATRLIFEAADVSRGHAAIRQALIDPDGHHLVIIESAKSDISLPTNVTANADAPSVSAKPE
jgi:catechol 2,3-dioxygenase-like lactoylglutathione lyase family enzyme